MNSFIEYYLANPWLCWGLAPSLSAALAIIGTATIFDWLAVQEWMHPYHITYGKENDRTLLLQKSHEKLAWWEQVKSTVIMSLGPVNIAGAVFNRYFFEYLYGDVSLELPSLMEVYFHAVLLVLLYDFFFYWFHRIQHENAWLFEHTHSQHHLVSTPTAFSTGVVDFVDAALASALPLISACAIIRPHPITFAVAIFCVESLTVQMHSGFQAWWIKWVTLKVAIPFVADVVQHDYHHRFVGIDKNGKNYGMIVWLWDWMFGTLCIPESFVHFGSQIESSETQTMD